MICAVLTAIVASGGVQVNAPSSTQQSLRLSRYPQLVSTRYTTRHGLGSTDVTRVWCSGDRVYAQSGPGVYQCVEDRWRAAAGVTAPKPDVDPQGLPAGATVASAARTQSGQWWLCTEAGAFRGTAGNWSALDLPRLYRVQQPAPNIDAAIRGVVPDGAGQLWLWTDRGAIVTDGAGWWHPLDRRDGMPYEDLTCLAFAPNGDVWGGTTQGAWRLRRGDWRYFWGKRWLPGNRIRSIACAVDGSVYVATDGGVARIQERQTTLAEKAARFEQITQSRHSRGGWVTGCGLRTPGDAEGGVRPEASDNDGLWTAIYVASAAFRYAVTKDRAALEAVRRSTNALLDLVRLSGYDGFPARAIIRKGEDVSGYDPDETVRVVGEANKIWYESPTHPGVLCKGDTSSDELDGHYFAWYVVHELAADQELKRAIATACRAVTDNLLKNQYTLVGHTGRKTRWGVFGPQYINDDPRWVDERGLNSLELLCYLKVAAHICRDARYSAAYEDLIARHHYLLNTLNYRRGTPWYALNHSDDELAYCTYYPLLLLEQAPERRAILLQSLATTWAGLKDERRPFYSIAFGALSGQPCQIEDAVAALQDWPWELINWQTRNSHRHDVTMRVAPGLVSNWTDRVLPTSERSLMRWASNPFEADGGGDGSSEEDGGAWLLAYWMARHHRLISE